MSLRKSPQLTPALLAAARQNVQHSTGPRSAAAKQNSKLNLPTAYCPPYSSVVRVGGAIGPYCSLRQDVALAEKEETLVISKIERTKRECY